MQFQIDSEETRQEWSRVLNREVGRVVYLSHDDYMKHRREIEEIQRKAGERKAKLTEH